MKKKAINPFMVGALALAMLCIFLFKTYMNQKQEEKEQYARTQAALAAAEAEARVKAMIPKSQEAPKVETKAIVYVKAPLQARTEVNETMLEMRDVPLELVPEGAFTEINQVVGKFTIRAIDAKEPATKSKIKSRGEIGALSFRITPGMRAISIRVSPESSAGNLINDGDFIDLMLTEADKDNNPTRTRIVLQNVKVLSFFASEESEQSAGLKKTAPDTVTVEVTPEQAEGLIQLSRMGSMSMVLRSVKDRSTVRTQGFAREEIQDDPGVVQGRSQRTLRAILNQANQAPVEGAPASGGQ